MRRLSLSLCGATKTLSEELMNYCGKRRESWITKQDRRFGWHESSLDAVVDDSTSEKTIVDDSTSEKTRNYRKAKDSGHIRASLR